MTTAPAIKTVIYEHKNTFWLVQTDPATKLARTSVHRCKSRNYVRELASGKKPVRWTDWKNLPIAPPPLYDHAPAKHYPVVQYTGPIDEADMFQ